jgi:hypothetical protein
MSNYCRVWVDIEGSEIPTSEGYAKEMVGEKVAASAAESFMEHFSFMGVVLFVRRPDGTLWKVRLSGRQEDNWVAESSLEADQ